ncbi:MAG: aspartyl protease family protein, partial [Bacteroidota bacterium]
SAQIPKQSLSFRSCLISLNYPLFMKLFLPFLTGICLFAHIGFVQAKITGFHLIGNAKSVKIPVEIQHNVVLIPVRINGSAELNFILDTGVKTTILTEPIMTQVLSLDSISKIKVRGLGTGDAIDAGLARDVNMSLPGVKGKGINLIVLPEGVISYSGMFGKPVFGILGYELFGQFTIEVNYQQKYIRISDPFRFRPGRKWDSIPIDIRASKPYVRATLTDYRGEKIKADWLLDTGASLAISLFDEKLPIPDPSVQAFLGQGLSGGVYGRLGRSMSLNFGGYMFEDIVTGYPDSASLNLLPAKSQWYGNIGAEVISRFRVIFDYPNERLLIRKTFDFRKPFDYNVSGLEVLSIGEDFDRFVISYVRPQSPAYHAGIKVGDQILGINGMMVDGAKIDDLYGSILRKTGKALSLKIRRNGKVMRIRFRLESEI